MKCLFNVLMQVAKKKVLAHLLNLQYTQLLPISQHNLHNHDLIATSTLAQVLSVSAACILALPANSVVRCLVVQGEKVVRHHIPLPSVLILCTGIHLVRYVWQFSECSSLFLIFHILIYRLVTGQWNERHKYCYKYGPISWVNFNPLHDKVPSSQKKIKICICLHIFVAMQGFPLHESTSIQWYSSLLSSS
jgi:hypothetical protein